MVLCCRYKSPPPPTGNLETRLPMIPTPPPPQQSQAQSARQTYSTSTPGIHRHTTNESNQNQSMTHLQHTPKRDKGPQLKPALNLMMPGGDVERHAHHDSTDNNLDEEKAALSGMISEGDAPKVVTFERIQFKQATANNGKRRAAQQYFS